MKSLTAPGFASGSGVNFGGGLGKGKSKANTARGAQRIAGRVDNVGPDGLHLANRKGVPLCQEFQTGLCTDLATGTLMICAKDRTKLHQCGRCLRPGHGAASCSEKSGGSGGSAKAKGRDAGQGDKWHLPPSSDAVEDFGSWQLSDSQCALDGSPSASLACASPPFSPLQPSPIISSACDQPSPPIISSACDQPSLSVHVKPRVEFTGAANRAVTRAEAQDDF
eukprot:3732033-Amphidinium_carterae.1